MRITFRKQLLWLISVAALAVASASFASVFGPQSAKTSPASSFDETMLPGPDIITGASLVALPNRPVRIARIVLPELPSTLQATQVTADLLKKRFGRIRWNLKRSRQAHSRNASARGASTPSSRVPAITGE